MVKSGNNQKMQWYEYTAICLSILLVYVYNWIFYSSQNKEFHQLYATVWMLHFTRSSKKMTELD